MNLLDKNSSLEVQAKADVKPPSNGGSVPMNLDEPFGFWFWIDKERIDAEKVQLNSLVGKVDIIHARVNSLPDSFLPKWYKKQVENGQKGLQRQIDNLGCKKCTTILPNSRTRLEEG
jgi:hypothetical protein